MTTVSERCASCGGTASGADAFLNLTGETVCRRCYYAEQTKLQSQRVEESKKQVGASAGDPPRELDSERR